MSKEVRQGGFIDVDRDFRPVTRSAHGEQKSRANMANLFPDRPKVPGYVQIREERYYQKGTGGTTKLKYFLVWVIDGNFFESRISKRVANTLHAAGMPMEG
jgi:hypothetical protein